jgi:hypothetical protein
MGFQFHCLEIPSSSELELELLRSLPRDALAFVFFSAFFPRAALPLLQSDACFIVALL